MCGIIIGTGDEKTQIGKYKGHFIVDLRKILKRPCKYDSRTTQQCAKSRINLK